MRWTDWHGHYKRWKLIFYLMVVVSPIMILAVLLILYFGPRWRDIYLIILIVIPIDIIAGLLIFLPRVRKAKKLLVRSFGEIQVEVAKAKIEEALKDMKSEYSELKKEMKADKSTISYDYQLLVKGREIEIRIRKIPLDNRTYVWVEYSQESDEEYSLQLCSKIENRILGVSQVAS